MYITNIYNFVQLQSRRQQRRHAVSPRLGVHPPRQAKVRIPLRRADGPEGESYLGWQVACEG